MAAHHDKSMNDFILSLVIEKIKKGVDSPCQGQELECLKK